MIRLNIIAIALFLFMKSNPVFSQDSAVNKYGIRVINSVDTYKRSIAGNPQKIMVALAVELPDAIYDLKYAGKHNFMHTKLYPDITTTYMRLDASEALSSVQRELKGLQMGIKIWDAYRPYSVTEKMWELVKDDRYAADPTFGSGHNRGIAVDLTVVDLTTGKEIDMGTGFDNFSDTAHHDFRNLPANVLQNRMLLRSVMEKHGFKALETEWWHYYFINGKDYELLDIPFEELYKIQ